MLVGILLPWIGGMLPSSVGYLCASLAGGRRSANLLLVVEGQNVPWTCQYEKNVIVHNVCKGCIADLHGKHLAAGAYEDKNLERKIIILKKLFRLVFRVAPHTIAEFKPVWGEVFAEYLRDYTHWTYTDTDMVFGNLDYWLLFHRRGLDDYDIETWTFEKDVERIFLRGQFTLHKNIKSINTAYTGCNHLTKKLEENLRNKFAFYKGHGYRPTSKDKKRHRNATDATFGTFNASLFAPLQEDCSPPFLARFISAEACYSCAILYSSEKFRIRVLPYLFSDHSNLPIIWSNQYQPPQRDHTHSLRQSPKFTTTLRRCADASCERHFFNKDTKLVKNQLNHSFHYSIPLSLDCHDMHWICRSSPRAALHAHPRFPFGPRDSISIHNRIATITHDPHTNFFFSPPAFHFRKWADYGNFQVAPIPSQPPNEQLPLRAFILRDSGITPSFSLVNASPSATASSLTIIKPNSYGSHGEGIITHPFPHQSSHVAAAAESENFRPLFIGKEQQQQRPRGGDLVMTAKSSSSSSFQEEEPPPKKPGVGPRQRRRRRRRVEEY